MSYEDLRHLTANYFERCSCEQLSEEETRTVTKKLARTCEDDEMVERIEQRSVKKEEMTKYLKKRENIESIESSKKMKEFLETSELKKVEDFEEFKRGADAQLDEMVMTESMSQQTSQQSTSTSSSQKQYIKTVTWSETIQKKYSME